MATPRHTLVSGHPSARESETLVYEDCYYYYRRLSAYDLVEVKGNPVKD